MPSLHKLIQRIATHPALTSLATRVLPPWVTVFMLHRLAQPELGIAGLAPSHLRDCLRYLQRNGYEFIDIDDAVERALNNQLPPKKWVAFTLDDGFAEQATLGADIFAEFNCPSTCFLITGFVDGDLWPWDNQLKYLAMHARPQRIRVQLGGVNHDIELGVASTKEHLLRLAREAAPQELYEAVRIIANAAAIDMPTAPSAEYQPAKWDQIRAAERLGMRFGAHSVSHRILAGLDDTQLRQELEQSIRRLRAECLNPSEIFCYPSGKADEFDARAMTIACELGLKGALSAEAGYLDASRMRERTGYRFVIPRLPLPKDRDDFRMYTSWVQYVRERFAYSPLRQFY